METYDDLPPVVRAMTEMHLMGNVVPDAWLKRVVSGKKAAPDYLAIHILADICYWYRASVPREESTGKIVIVRKKFQSDKLQRSYAQLAEKFPHGKPRIKQAVDLLVSLGLITREFRTVESTIGSPNSNVMFLEPVPDAISEFSRPVVEDQRLERMLKIYNSSRAHTKKGRGEKLGTPSYKKLITPSSKKLGGRIQGLLTSTTTGKGDSYSPPSEDGEKIFPEKPPAVEKQQVPECISEHTPERLGKAIVSVTAAPVKLREEKCVELQRRFPVVELVNTILEDEVEDTRELVPLWNRIRGGAAALTITPENLFEYAMYATLGEFKYPTDLKGFLNAHESEPSMLLDARVNGVSCLRYDLRARHEEDPFLSREDMVAYAEGVYGKYAASKVVPGWFDGFTEKKRIKEAEEKR